MRLALHRRVPGASALSLALVAVATLAGACADAGASPLAPSAGSQAAQRSSDAIVDLNPQPEPPSLRLDFRLTPDGTDWFGTIFVGDQACGSMQLRQTSSRQTGVVTHVGYGLSIQGTNPDFQMDADLSGIVVRGRVVLNGTVAHGAYAGQTLHPRGQIVVPPPNSPIDLTTTLTGAVQLNPQPEPPAPAYPPSPCITG